MVTCGNEKKFKILGDFEAFESSGEKKRLNLSDYADFIIKEDMRHFNNGEENVSGTYNRIFRNFYNDAEASISLRYLAKDAELRELFSSKNFKKIDESITDRYIGALLVAYESELKEKVASYKKEVQSTYRIDKKNLDIIRKSSLEAQNYNESVSAYVKAVLEEYATRPMYEREQIYFKDRVETVESAISQRKKLRIITRTTNYETNTTDFNRYIVCPYKLCQDKAKMYNYIVGLSEKIDKDGAEEQKIASFRLAFIESIDMMSEKSFISKDKQALIDSEIKSKGVQFLIGKVEAIKVRFTDRGVYSFNHQFHLRPTEYEKVDGEKNTYVFKCTRQQARNYFFKFGGDVEVLEPDGLRNDFIRLYREAFDRYKD